MDKYLKIEKLFAEKANEENAIAMSKYIILIGICFCIIGGLYFFEKNR